MFNDDGFEGYDEPHFWLEVALKQDTRIRDWVIPDYLVPRLAAYEEKMIEEIDHWDAVVDVKGALVGMDPDKTNRCFEFAVADALREIANRHLEEYDEIIAEKFVEYATEKERLGLDEKSTHSFSRLLKAMDE